MYSCIRLSLVFPLVVCDVNQLTKRQEFVHQLTWRDTESLPPTLYLFFAASLSCYSEQVGSRLFQMSFWLFFLTTNIPAGSPLRFVNLHLVGMHLYDSGDDSELVSVGGCPH